MSRSRGLAGAVLITLLAALPAACGEAMSEEEEGIPVAEEAPPPPGVETGTHVGLTLRQGLSTKDDILGRPFEAVVTENVRGSDGSVMIPAGATVVGRVAEAKKSTDDDVQAFIRLDPQSLVIDGRTYPISATVVESDIEAETADEVEETVTKVAVGAAAGAIAGKVIGGGGSDAAKGAVVGAVAGGVVAGVTRPGHAEIDAGGRVVIRLDERLVVGRR